MGFWANSIRHKEKNGDLPADRKQRLIQAGFAFVKPGSVRVKNLMVIPACAEVEDAAVEAEEGDGSQVCGKEEDDEDATEPDAVLLCVSPEILNERPEERIIARPEGYPIAVSSLENLLEKGCRFKAVMADPPWRYNNTSSNGAAEQHYTTMDMEALCKLPVPKLVLDDSWLFLWATSPLLKEALELMEAWGFTYKTNMVWAKTKFGMGNYWRSAHELLLLGVRGSPGPWLRHDIGSFAIHPATRHSAKPAIFRDMITSVVDGPYLELFGREDATGWTVFGNQVQPTLFATQNEDRLAESQQAATALPAGKSFPDASFCSIFSLNKAAST
ncbi:site-specific DNA-methyltransferase (adenine-specific) [Acidithiobacillus caldus SM-1]|uniref:Site-specific DNA-methyltransferase (Adenine-specific) n=1 Tax=Acidithiobacillus caldus (strain SM-1) TaxID=990288 RepID=F9ZQI2_ACICS|nr:site-specific DNA-methyltransferase (adenine-specific) [Acidithiobacillus caldus SM-1]